MQGILFLKDCEKTLVKYKPEELTPVTWTNPNKKALTYIKMVVSDKILIDLKCLYIVYEMWEKLESNLMRATGRRTDVLVSPVLSHKSQKDELPNEREEVCHRSRRSLVSRPRRDSTARHKRVLIARWLQ